MKLGNLSNNVLEAMADHFGGKRETEVKFTSGCRRRVENVWCLSSLLRG